MEKRPDALIEIALRALRQTRKFLGGRTLAAYLADDQCQSAVERQLEIAGDALGGLRKLDAALFGRIPEGDLVVAFRNVLAHGYATLDHRRVYGIATTRVSELTSVLERMLAQMPEEGAGGKR
ncbi:MAG: DUF86 domain-containing protein [Gammaproteobacteria bacterium]|nr:MAG: DUF86 domain-containing protein [Gammaproteobacteria bacterium]